MRSNALVTVVLPTHNRSHMMSRAVKSIQSQTYKELEIIIILDGCVDESKTIVDDIARDDNRIVVVENNESVGAMASRIKGINMASGKYIAFLDDDDVWISDKIERQVEVLNTRDDIGIVGCDYERNRSGNIVKSSQKTGVITLDDMKYTNELGSFSFCMTRAENLKKLQLEKSVKSCQDWYVWLSLLLESKKEAYVLDEILCIYDDSDHERISNKKSSKIAGYNFMLDSFSAHFSIRQISSLRFLKNFSLIKNQSRSDGRLKLFYRAFMNLIKSRHNIFNNGKMLIKYTFFK